VARSSNKKLGVTGALLITDDEFVQTLEGPEPVVRALYTKINKDKRHEHVELLESGAVSGRVFAGGLWARWPRTANPTSPCWPTSTRGYRPGAAPAEHRGAGNRPGGHAPVAAALWGLCG